MGQPDHDITQLLERWGARRARGPRRAHAPCVREHGGVEAGSRDVLTLAPGAWRQLTGPLSARGLAGGWAVVRRVSGTAPWLAYGVVNDGGRPGERTGDGAYVPMALGAP